MRRRQLPPIWYFTDPRVGEALWPALERLPRGTGVVFRHYGVAARGVVLARVRSIARRRGLALVVAGGDHRAGEGTHLGSRFTVHRRRGVVTAAAHDRAGLIAARRSSAALVFVSPVFATRSHAGATPLGPVRLGLMVRGVRVAVAALGGMTRARFRRVARIAAGWGAIDGLTPSRAGD